MSVQMTYEEKLKQIALADERVMVLTAENRAAIRGLPAVLGPRFLDTGITEQTMIGAAAGLALRGRIPVCHALSTFLLLRAYEFVRSDVGIGNLPVKLVGAVPGFLSDGNGPTHQAIEDISILRTIPNMNIFCPGDVEELVAGMETVVNTPQAWYVRFNPRPRPDGVTHSPFEVGKAEVLSEGHDVGLLVYGTLLTEAVAAAALLRAQGHTVRLVNLRTVKPVDEAEILRTMEQTRLTVTLEDHFLTGGLFTIVSEILARNKRVANLLPLALDNHWFRPGRLNEVLDYEGFTAPKLADKISNSLKGVSHA